MDGMMELQHKAGFDSLLCPQRSLIAGCNLTLAGVVKPLLDNGGASWAALKGICPMNIRPA